GLYSVVASKGDVTGGWRAFLTSGNSPVLFWGTDSQQYVGSTLTATLGVWQHVIWGYNATAGAGFYALNGVYQSFVIANQPGTNALTVKIGRCGPSGQAYFVNGGIDDVAIYPTALTAAQIAAHYQLALASGGDSFRYWSRYRYTA